MSSSGATIQGPGGPALGGGTLPSWAPYAVVAGSAALVAAVLAAMGSFKVVLMIVLAVVVSGVALYAVSRAVEGPRQATNRTVTLSSF